MPIEFGFSLDQEMKPEFTYVAKDADPIVLKDIENGRMLVLLSLNDQDGGKISLQSLEGSHAYMPDVGLYKINPTGEHSYNITPNESTVLPIQFEGSEPGYLWIRHFIKT